jgi:hypothetical protein
MQTISTSTKPSMTRYFFDLGDGEDVAKDADGLDLPHDETARREAIKGLVDMVAELLPDGESRQFSVLVRTDDGRQVFEADLRFRSSWLGGA